MAKYKVNMQTVSQESGFFNSFSVKDGKGTLTENPGDTLQFNINDRSSGKFDFKSDGVSNDQATFKLYRDRDSDGVVDDTDRLVESGRFNRILDNYDLIDGSKEGRRDLLLVFEDQQRPAGDRDYNDMVVSIEIDPILG